MSSSGRASPTTTSKIGRTVWNYAEIYRAIARELPDLPCQVQGDHVTTWAQFDRRSDAVAAHLLSLGLPRQAKVAVLLRNCPQYIEAYVGCFKAALTPLNVNYRYGHDEVVHVLTNGDAEALIFHTSLTEVVDGARPDLPRVGHFIALEDPFGAGPASVARTSVPQVPEWAHSYEQVATSGGPLADPPGLSGDDALLQYTGGTTGLPKGVLWRQDTVISALGGATNFYQNKPAVDDLDGLVRQLERGGKRLYVACPLMHATGLFTGLSLMNEGWAVETTAAQRFSAPAMLQTLSEHQVNAAVIVGDAFARPLLAELEANGPAYNLHHLELIISAGSVWSQRVRQGFLDRLPWVLLCDNYGSSEALRGVQTYSRPGQVPESGVIEASERLHLMDEHGALLQPALPEDRGALLISGHLADGYYNDSSKSASTWVTIDGRRYCVTGDSGEVEPDGSIRLLGRGNSVINTGGEKVFPQEVEDVVRTHPSVLDAAVVGLPHERFGQVVVAVVVLRADAELDQGTLGEHVRRHLADYKLPRRMAVVDRIPRTAAGKVDYATSRSAAVAALAKP
ncbi:MAG: AMP-binding protein [Intrasporangium sp.]|uniref:AMP-binding protein n=1 Tax=Intrasporangium sp. TaxID=1925024 RepID=UPI002648E501|nr:AMP-binding protein [Intrasporangium sp.]MDN5794883.1 AMP-binding protein [Intrasporangium sp.]